MDLHLAGKRALITGGSRGIGAAVATALAEEGVNLALFARGAQQLSAHAQALRGRGVAVVTRAVDTTDAPALSAAVEGIASELGGVDILVNAAAMPASPAQAAPFAQLEAEDLRREIETKVLGYLRAAQAVAPMMIAQRWGRIINVSGLAARQTGSVFGSIRNVAVSAMTKNLADELGPSGINVTVVHPALTVTERTPELIRTVVERRGLDAEQAAAQLASQVSIGRLVTAAEVADVIAFLASPRSVAINGDAVAVGGGIVGSIHY
jgi:NAD(P)-dependent dehydrogenase (short-subunit alcohol dehydrogenase family)